MFFAWLLRFDFSLPFRHLLMWTAPILIAVRLSFVASFQSPPRMVAFQRCQRSSEHFESGRPRDGLLLFNRHKPRLLCISALGVSSGSGADRRPFVWRAFDVAGSGRNDASRFKDVEKSHHHWRWIRGADGYSRNRSFGERLLRAGLPRRRRIETRHRHSWCDRARESGTTLGDPGPLSRG